ncbi:type 1 glutamine amidotransferase domain-containing protein [Solirubrobacter soli]|uniref:type 1 glutamine amidotransferase domain-containing protein n=1 Tax=Solirubrobacter soli TaxID=363832 RepID=UPI00047F12F6|nr:type 1 glutamine amidotransferase domain-containing protein [Solirubrobacter soli]
MRHSDLNPVDPARPKRAAIVISNPGVSTTTGWPVGFWWSELTHPYFAFTGVGWEVDVYSPQGGRCEWDALSDPEDASRWQAEDVISRGYKHDPGFLKLIEATKPVDDLDVEAYDVLVVAGGQGPMFTFEHATNLHAKFAEFHATGKVTAALCHGVAVLAYATLADGTPLVRGRTVTGFPNVEEDEADRLTWEAGALPEGQRIMPWRVEDALKDLGANFIQAGAFRSFAIRDGNLVTGQQNFSGGDVAREILEAVGR